jgi:hypothetical protein
LTSVVEDRGECELSATGGKVITEKEIDNELLIHNSKICQAAQAEAAGPFETEDIGRTVKNYSHLGIKGQWVLMVLSNHNQSYIHPHSSLDSFSRFSQ